MAGMSWCRVVGGAISPQITCSMKVFNRLFQGKDHHQLEGEGRGAERREISKPPLKA